MGKLLRKIFYLLIVALLYVVSYSSLYADTPRQTYDFLKLPSNIFEAVCLLGEPVQIRGWATDPATRFIEFKGAFKDWASDDIYSYVVYSLDKPQDTRAVSKSLIQRIVPPAKEYDKSDELERYKLPVFRGVPDKLSKLERQLGKWDYSYIYKKIGNKRLVYEMTMCVGKKLAYGAYFDIRDGKITRAKGITSIKSLNKHRKRAGKQPVQ